MSRTSTFDPRSYTILLVDDMPASLAVATAHLEKQGFQIMNAENGEMALEVAELEHPDLILLDVLMPGMDGFETCRRLKASESTREIPVILMTALTETADKVAGFQAGGVDYVTKPFEIDEMMARVETHLTMHTMRKQIEEQNARLQAIIDNSTAVIYVKDVEGRYVLINRRCQELFHVTQESIVGRTDYDLFPPARAEAFRASDRQVLVTQKPLEVEEIVPQDDGPHTYISTKCLLRDATGKPYAVCNLSTDITERKRAEEEREALLASEQAARSNAEAADRLKDEFLAVLSHELRTPLTAILGWARLLRTGAADAAAIRRGIEVIERNSLSELQLVEDLLDISAILRDKMDLNAQSVCLAPLIQSALDSVRPAAEAKSVCISLSLSSKTSTVWGDRGRLQQVLGNLLSNAIKFTPSGGRVAVSLQEIGSTARIQISDTGEGINAEFLPHMFDRFRQADSSTRRNRGGLGLGLSIVRHLVEIHSGKVWAESDGEGHGATLTVDLPLMPVAVEEAAALPSAGATASSNESVSSTLVGVRVLVIDDESDVRELVTRMLALAGAEVRVATVAQEGFEIFEQWRPDVIVSDIGLPGEDGYALIRRIRALPVDRGGHTPAAALTAYVGQDAHKQALSAGYQVHVPKPVEPTALIAEITKLASCRGCDIACV